MSSDDQEATASETSEKEPLSFTKMGNYSDEVRLIFDDEKELYVSEFFLKMLSPVFGAMFGHNFKEKKSMSVNLEEKAYDDFLELLLCCHPRILKPITTLNVFRIAPIAEEYQVSAVIQQCQASMKSLLDSSYSNGQNSQSAEIPATE